jgi:hypothetical protein
VVYKRLFASEDFDKEMLGWRTDATGPMHGANQALSYIVFKRDRSLFEREFPSLELVVTFPLSNYHLRYLFSGGLNFRQLVPTFTEPALRALERALRPARRVLGLAPRDRAAPACLTRSGRPVPSLASPGPAPTFPRMLRSPRWSEW